MGVNEDSTKIERTRRSARKRSVNKNSTTTGSSQENPKATVQWAEHSLIEQALVTGEDPGLLEDYFGEGAYSELRQLAREAAMRRTRGGTRVLILPGIMGSKLGPPGDEIWLDFLDVAKGRLSDLAIVPGASDEIQPLGVLLTTYLKLKYRLLIGGFDADFWPFDWRVSVADTGSRLADAIAAAPDEVHLVAHSMGGLVARACLGQAPPKLGRVITLGTPHYGSFAPLQAFRGAHSVVRKLAFLDLHHDQNELAAIFGTFQGLSEMFPMPGKVPLDLFDLSAWPAAGPRPDQALLARAREVQRRLPTGEASRNGIIQIVGVNQQTVVGAEVVGSEFVYTLTNEGDGTVPLACARLADATRTYYVEEEHGALPNNAAVARAIQSLIATGDTKELSADFVPRRGGTTRTVRESDLGVDVYEGMPGRRLSSREERIFLSDFAAPSGSDEAMRLPGLPSTEAFDEIAFADRLVISRQSHRHLDVTLAFGSLTEVDADAYVLGLFKNVALGGAALAVDRLLADGITQTLGRRMFNGNVGEVSILPAGRHPIRTDFVAFVGLGPIDSFKESTLETVGENLIRTCVTAHVGDFATVLMGGSSGMHAKACLARLLAGFVRGLLDSDKDHLFHRITLCENDPARYAQLTRDMYALCGGTLFDGIQVTLRTRTLPSPPSPQATWRAERSRGEAIYLLVRQVDDERDRPGIAASVLTKGRKAAIHRGWKLLDEAALEKQLALVANGAPKNGDMPNFGRVLADLVLPEVIQTVLGQFPDDHVVVVHDARASRIPWEALCLKDRPLALGGGVSHRYEADDLSVAKWLEERLQKPTLQVLLIVNPTEDLDDAKREGDRVEALISKEGRAEVRRIDGRAARRSELLQCFQSGAFDVVHYAGHAFFDANAPSRSGILCSGHEVLSGADLAGLSNLPSLVFFNACEVARIRRAGPEPTPARAPDLLRRNIGFAEAFLRGGVANFIGTYWPVADPAAATFAPIFYGSLLAGQSLAEALMKSREALDAKSFGDWANYILYGDPEFVLKRNPKP